VKGINTQINNPISNARHGETRNKITLALAGIIASLNNNLRPSAKACRAPQKPVTFGPLRR
jgi:hypothetical protein